MGGARDGVAVTLTLNEARIEATPSVAIEVLVAEFESAAELLVVGIP
jgi:hypothetical protein